MLEKQVQVISNDGRVFIGILRGIDNALNIVLQEA